jgi:hypothetical protein
MTDPMKKKACEHQKNYSRRFHPNFFHLGHSPNAYKIFSSIIERNEEIVKAKTKKKKHNLSTGYASFSSRLESKFDATNRRIQQRQATHRPSL